MKQTKALRRMLEDMTAVYNDGQKTEVAFTTGTPHASETARDCGCDASGEHVAVATNVRKTYGKSMDGANELRVITDTLNHEMEHVRSSPLTAKREFSARYPQCSAFAGMVLNVLEDQYIDWQRLKRFRGLRGAHSFKVDAIMANGSRRPPLYNLEQSEQVAEGFLQMAFSGYVKGFSDAEREVQEAIVKCRPLVDMVRNEHDPLEREQIAHTCMSILLEAVPDPEDTDEYTDENSEQMPTDEPADVTPEDVQRMLDDLEPEDLEDQEGEGPSVAIDPDEYDVPEWLEDEMEEAEGGEQEATSAPEQEDDPWADDSQQEQGDEQEQEDEGEGEQEGDESGDTSSEGEQQPGSPDMNTSPGSPDQPDSTVGGEGERKEDGTASGVDPVDVEQGIQEMEKRERQRDAGEHWNAGDTDHTQPDQEFERRYQTIQQEVQQEQTELGQQKRRRSERIQQHEDQPSYERLKDSHEKIRELLRSDGTAEDIVEAFKKFKTQDRWLPDTRGERLNTRNATRRLAGDYSEDRVYDRKLKAEVGDRCVGVAMDLSGSMNGFHNLRQPKMALGALYIATKTIGDDLLATGYKTYDNHPQKGDYEPVLDLITGPQEGFEWEHLDGAKAGMYTPTADGVMYTLDLLKKSHRREKVMVVITDGKANIPLGGGTRTSSSKGREDAKRAVNTARQNGVKVLGMAVGRVGDTYMDDVFGADSWVHTGSDTLTEDLVELYRDQMRVDPSGMV